MILLLLVLLLLLILLLLLLLIVFLLLILFLLLFLLALQDLVTNAAHFSLGELNVVVQIGILFKAAAHGFLPQVAGILVMLQ